MVQPATICAGCFVVWSGFGAILAYLPVFLQEQACAAMWLIGVVGWPERASTRSCEDVYNEKDFTIINA